MRTIISMPSADPVALLPKLPAWVSSIAYGVPWAAANPKRGVVSTSAVTPVLDAAARVGKQVSLSIYMRPDTAHPKGSEPSWLWTGNKRPSPWDVKLQQAWADFWPAFVKALGPKGATIGRVQAELPGWELLRKSGTRNLCDLSGYTREGLLSAVRNAVYPLRRALPQVVIESGLWTNLTDHAGGVPLWQAAGDTIRAYSNVTVSMDNLSSIAPTASYAESLRWMAARGAAITWEAKGAWARPTPEQTDLTGTPMDGIAHAESIVGDALQTVRLYPPDLLTPAFAPALEAWLQA